MRQPCSRATRWVYPRVNGETVEGLNPVSPIWGLSPRERGNPLGYRAQHKVQRSIPA